MVNGYKMLQLMVLDLSLVLTKLGFDTNFDNRGEFSALAWYGVGVYLGEDHI